ncbi:hypothetical protein FOZ62_017962, partial [Perkinsus olseni]
GRQCIGKPAPLSNGFRFAAEQAVARGNAYLLRVLGWRWSLTASTELFPPCFEADEDRRHCCSEAAFYGKTLCYLDGTYSFDRCCKSMVIGLRKVYDDDDDGLPQCIDVTDVMTQQPLVTSVGAASRGVVSKEASAINSITVGVINHPPIASEHLHTPYNS